MRISAVIPSYNSEKTIRPCLEAIFNSDYKDFEVIFVNDASIDKSAEIAKLFPCKVIYNKTNLGKAASKNIGLGYAVAQTVVFIDSDVIIEKNTLQSIADVFKNNPALAAVMGMPTSQNPYLNFTSQYKTIYMSYIFSRMPRAADFLHGSIQAFNRDMVFKKYSLLFDERLYCDDIEMGVKIKEKGGDILLSQDIHFTHMKSYTLRSLLKNDYRTASGFARILLRYKLLKRSLRNRRFAHTSLLQALAVANSFLIAMMLLGILLTGNPRIYGLAILLFFLHFVLSLKFYRFIYQKKGLIFTAISTFFNPADQFVMFLGMICGAIAHVKNFLKNLPKQHNFY